MNGGSSGTAEQTAFNRCVPHLRRCLDVGSIFPQLCQKELLTQGEKEVLVNDNWTNTNKVDKLVVWLPNKPAFFQRFTDCLADSADGTKHGELVIILQDALRDAQSNNSEAMEWETPQQQKHESESDSDEAMEWETLIAKAPAQRSELQIREPPQHPTCWQRYRKRCLYCCWPTVVIAVVVTALTFIPLALLPSTEQKVEPAYVWEGTTVELHFNLDNSWLDHVSMSISDCSGPLYVLPGSSCSHLYSQLTYYSSERRQGLPSDPIYLLPGSSINISIPEGADADIWIFSKWDLANNFVESPHHFRCDAAPSGAYCFNSTKYAGGTHFLPINNPGYYIVRYIPNSHTHNISRIYQKRQYDYTKLSSRYKPVLTLSDDRTETLKLSSYFQYGKSCIILHIDFCMVSHGKLNAKEVKRRSDIFLFPGFLLFFLLVALALIAVATVRYCRQRRVPPA